jgi:hypothetical protein
VPDSSSLGVTDQISAAPICQFRAHRILLGNRVGRALDISLEMPSTQASALSTCHAAIRGAKRIDSMTLAAPSDSRGRGWTLKTGSTGASAEHAAALKRLETFCLCASLE